MLGGMPPWDLRRYRFTAPVWWDVWRRSRRKRIVRVSALAGTAILYGIAIYLGC